MVGAVFSPDDYIRNLKAKQQVNAIAQPVIDQYYTEFRAKLKPTVQEPPPDGSNESQLQFYLVNLLSPILHSQTSNFIERIRAAGDLKAFAKFGKNFLEQVKNVNNLDSSFLFDLWAKYKKKMLIASESSSPAFQGQTSNEYAKSINKNYYKVPTSEEFNNPQIVVHPGATSISAPDTRLREIVVHPKHHHALSSIQKSISNTFPLRNAKKENELANMHKEDILSRNRESYDNEKNHFLEDINRMTQRELKDYIKSNQLNIKKNKSVDNLKQAIIKNKYPTGNGLKLKGRGIGIIDSKKISSSIIGVPFLARR